MTVDLASVTLSSELLEAVLHLCHRLRVGWSGKGAASCRIETVPAAGGQVHRRPCMGGRMVTLSRRVLYSMWMRRTVGLITSPLLLLG
jgi:hypothetical protein